MADISELRQELAMADRHLAEGNRRIARQAKVVSKLDGQGHDTTPAVSLLRAMEEAVAAMDTHRQQIVRELLCAPDEHC